MVPCCQVFGFVTELEGKGHNRLNSRDEGSNPSSAFFFLVFVFVLQPCMGVEQERKFAIT